MSEKDKELEHSGGSAKGSPAFDKLLADLKGETDDMEATKEKHAFTPGPWYAHGTKVSTWETQDEIDFHGDEVIAETGFNANARLIAAAPEMYEMLRDLSKVVKNLESIGASLPYYFKDDMSMSDKLREVLAKVEGG